MKEIATLTNTIQNVQLMAKFTEMDVILVKPFAWQKLGEKIFNSKDVHKDVTLISPEKFTTEDQRGRVTEN